MTIKERLIATLAEWGDECRRIQGEVRTDEERESYGRRIKEINALATEVATAPLQADQENDYTWVPDWSDRVWITLGGNSISLRLDGGKQVEIETFLVGKEDEDPLDQEVVILPVEVRK